MNSFVTLFSIIVPIFNAEKNIDIILKQFKSQNNGQFEVILVDDGSSDSSLSICQKYAKDDSFFVLFSQKNQGASAARNLGLKHARGEYVLFADSDDRISDEYIRLVTQACEKYNSDLIQFNWLQGTLNNGYKPAYEDLVDGACSVENYCHELLRQKFNPPWNKVYRRDLIEKHHIRFNTSMVMGEDLEFTIQYVKHMQSVSIDSSCIYKYLLNEYGLCARASLSYFQDLRKIYDAMNELIAHKLLDSSSQLYANDSMTASIFRVIGGCMQSGFAASEIKLCINGTGFSGFFKSMRCSSFDMYLRKKLIQLGLYDIILLLFRLKNGSGGRV